MKTVSILGATGSVGMQALDVARSRGYKVDFLTAGSNISALEGAVREFSPALVAVSDISAAKDLRERIADTSTRVLAGDEGILEGISLSRSEVAVNSIIGEAGLLPTLAVIDSGKRLALANKESLVIAGEIVMKRARERGVEIIPVDSEHSAIFQSKKSGKDSEIKRILLTASGGPFFGMSREELRGVTLEDTLAHPTWKMGKKITVDSATLMNKGFEVIEACHLFGVGADNIRVLVHRESILHSAVEYIDNSVIGEMSVPDMRMCVQYAVDYPDRAPSVCAELDLVKVGSLTFREVDTEAFPLLAQAFLAMSDGGSMPAVLNAADECAVAAFLNGKIRFSDVSEVVLATYARMAGAVGDSVEALIASDREARRVAENIIKEIG